MNETAEQFVRMALEHQIADKQALHLLKLDFARASGAQQLLPDMQLLAAYRELVEAGHIPPHPDLERVLKRRQIRTASGVVPVAVSTAPGGCPYRCVYCPTEPDMPKSYLANEPGMRRAARHMFDPQRQVLNRLQTLANIGHANDKVELIVIGGTFTTYPADYQESFIKGCFDACNGYVAASLAEAHAGNETAPHRIIGLSIETRPDEIDPQTIRELRRLGVTRVEMGVQSTHEDVLRLTRRAHSVADTVQATQLLKDAGFKICYHMMPNLPGSDPDRDVAMFHTLFSDSRFRPDMLKIYPTMVVQTAELYGWWRSGRYTPYDDETLIDVLMRAKQVVPPYVRINRVVRDFPSESVVAGTHRSDMRQEVLRRMQAQGLRCQCIRCREVRQRAFEAGLPQLVVREYEASGGQEFFLSFEDEAGLLYGLIRLRIPSQIKTGEPHFLPVLQDAALIRELHTYGIALGVGQMPTHEAQHRGLGRRLVRAAEQVAREEGIPRMAIIAGVGVRGYFRRLGYQLEDTYMVRRLDGEPET